MPWDNKEMHHMMLVKWEIPLNYKWGFAHFRSRPDTPCTHIVLNVSLLYVEGGHPEPTEDNL